MKKLLMVLALVLLAVVQMEAQKTVTYTFKGRAKGYILPPKPIDLVASGAVPAGVTISNIYVTKDADDNDVNNSYTPGDDDIHDVDMDGFLGSALLTEYVVQPRTEARIHFDGFRYEVVGVKWSRCSEIAVLTSQGETTARNYANGEINNFNFSTAGEERYTTSGELFYHTRDFLPGYDYVNNPIKGLSMLKVHCTSKLPQHGIAIRDFKITYWAPEITIYKEDANESPVTKLDPGQSDNIRATITGHRGAFTDAEIRFYSSNRDAATIDPITGEITTNSDPNYVGNTIITAKIEYGGGLVSKTTYRLTVGSVERQWSFCDIYNNYSNAVGLIGDGSVSGKCATNSGKTQFTGLRSNNVLPSASLTLNNCFEVINEDYPANGQYMSLKLNNITNYEPPQIGVAKVKYHLEVPAYSSVDITYGGSTKATYVSGKNADSRVDVVHIGQKNEWPFLNGADKDYFGVSHTYTADDINNLNTTYDFKASGNTASTNSIYGKSGNPSQLDGSWTNPDPDVYSRATYPTGGSFDDYFALSLGHLEHSLGSGTSFNLECQFRINSPATYTYYAYVTFDGNGADNTITETQTWYTDSEHPENNKKCHQIISHSADPNVKAYKGSGTRLSLGSGNEYVKDKYVFVGWNSIKENADKGEVEYADGAYFSPYFADEERGHGPITLYAVWRKLPTSLDPTDPGFEPDEDIDYLVYQVNGNGGTIGTKERLEGLFVTGIEAPASLPTPDERTGYTFNGYSDEPDGGVTLYNNLGEIVKNDATQEYYLTPDGKWKATADVLLYALWHRESTPTAQTIHFDVNGDGGSITSSSLPVIKGETDNNNVNSLAPTRSGYKFAGWYTLSGDGEGIMAYNANGESVILGEMSKDANGVNVATLKPLNEHFFNANSRFVGDEAPFDADIFTLYAHWIKDDLVIAFHEGSTSAHSAIYKEGVSAAISAGQDGSTPMQSPSYVEGAEYGEVIVTRNLKSDQWNTICFPCFMTEAQKNLIFSEVKLYKALEYADGDANMKFKDSKEIIPGYPYFVKLKSTPNTDDNEDAWVTTDGGLTSVHVKNSELSLRPSTITKSDNGVTVSMVGEFDTHIHIEEGNYFLLDNLFYISGETYGGKEIWGNNKGFRCYFTVDAPKANNDATPSRLRMHIDLEGYDGYTGDGVEEIETEESIDASNAIYDLSGRRMTHAPRQGIYIMGGKKFMVK